MGSEGSCEVVGVSTNKISMGDVHLKSGKDVTILHKMGSQYESWEVRRALQLTELGSDDWALLAQLLPTLTRVENVETTSNSTSHPAQETLRQLWDKTEGGW